MAHLKDLFPSKYLKAADLAEYKRAGRLPLRVTISRVIERETVGMNEDAQERPVVFFQNATKGMVLNRINAATLAEVAGSGDTDNWIGVTLGLDVRKDRYKSDVVDCLRFVALRGQPQQAAAPSAPARRAVHDQATRAARVAAPAPAPAFGGVAEFDDSSTPPFADDDTERDDVPF